MNVEACKVGYLHNLISLQPPRCTRTSSVVTLAGLQASYIVSYRIVISQTFELYTFELL